MIHYFLTIIEQSFLFAPLVFGGYITIALMKLPDLSLEAAFLVGAIATGKIIAFYGEITTVAAALVVIFGTVFAGMIIGTLSFALTRIAQLPHLLSSLIIMGLMHGIGQALLQTSLLPLASHQTLLTVLPGYPEIVPLGFIFIILTLLLHLFLKTSMGISLKVYGSNPNFFEPYHISTNSVIGFGLLLGNGLAALSGSLIAQAHGFVEITMSTGMALQAITALMLGNVFYKTFIKENKASVAISILGISLYFSIQQLLLRLGFDLKYFTMIQALTILIIMIMRYKSDGTKKTNQLGV